VRWRFWVLVAALVAVGAAVLLAGPPSQARLAGFVATAGPLGPAAAVLGSALLVAAMVPRTLLAAIGGLLFGSVAGGLYVLVGAVLGASVAFAVGRWLGRDFVAGRLRPGTRLGRFDRWLTARGALSVAAARLVPVAPFGVMSYAFGTSGVRFTAFIAGTAFAVTPSTLVYAFLGAHSLRPGSPAFLYGVGGATLLAVVGTLVTTRLATRNKSGDKAGPDISPIGACSGSTVSDSVSNR